VTVSPGIFHLRWFTPAVKIDLGGHTTLAAAHVLFHELGFEKNTITFQTLSGDLLVSRAAEKRIALDFPRRPATPVPPAQIPTGLLGTLGLTEEHIVWIGRSRDWLVVLKNEATLAKATPDFAALRALKRPPSSSARPARNLISSPAFSLQISVCPKNPSPARRTAP